MIRAGMIVALTLAAASFGGYGTVQGQSTQSADCCEQCGSCSFPPGTKKGYYCGSGTSETYGMDCYTDCSRCVLFTASAPLPEERIRDLLVGPSPDLDLLASDYSGHLLVNAPRNMVVVLGSGCSGDAAISSIHFVERETIETLRRLGIGSYQDYVAGRLTAT
jgi:hypothetical protein